MKSKNDRLSIRIFRVVEGDAEGRLAISALFVLAVLLLLFAYFPPEIWGKTPERPCLRCLFVPLLLQPKSQGGA